MYLTCSSNFFGNHLSSASSKHIQSFSVYFNISFKVFDFPLKLYKSNNNVNKTSVYTLKNHLTQGYLKVFTKKDTRNKKYILKISGIWETHSEIGITYKLLECSYL